MRSTKKTRALGQVLALSFVLGAGGCVVLGYNFDKKPPDSCERTADCPGVDSDCGKRACTEGVCTYVEVKDAGEKPLGQPRDDCQDVTCDGKGLAVSKPAPLEVPLPGDECAVGQCFDGTPLVVPKEKDTPCGKDGALACDGAGFCAGCTMPSECGDDNLCLKWSCTEGICIGAYEPVGTILADTVKGDCMAEACDGAGGIDQIPYPMDAADDMNPCTADICKGTTTEHENAANGTPCETGCRACTDGVCGECSEGTTCVAEVCVSNGAQPVGSACAGPADCKTGFCIDNICCESACAEDCMGCGNTTTGQPNGICAPALDNTNPGGRCEGLDVCIGGTCRCENGVLDGNELKVDCGGTCAPCKGTWVCNGTSGCGAPVAKCCAFDCIGCDDETAACFELQNTPCFIGENPKTFTGGTFWDICAKCNRMTCLCQ
ncbi:hypothetical protein [Polyangium spumosum]|uniref:Uncharacterized protein n=1 Tax=Polyangium spumosum TaxID=889282 RepID=A0A6N7Q610_9BACT|nr:hypothetical protein [Polyangium spumosum]MRG96291.1 hypothetical protein [Polyangium spumosum]